MPLPECLERGFGSNRKQCQAIADILQDVTKREMDTGLEQVGRSVGVTFR